MQLLPHYLRLFRLKNFVNMECIRENGTKGWKSFSEFSIVALIQHREEMKCSLPSRLKPEGGTILYERYYIND